MKETEEKMKVEEDDECAGPIVLLLLEPSIVRMVLSCPTSRLINMDSVSHLLSVFSTTSWDGMSVLLPKHVGISLGGVLTIALLYP